MSTSLTWHSMLGARPTGWSKALRFLWWIPGFKGRTMAVCVAISPISIRSDQPSHSKKKNRKHCYKAKWSAARDFVVVPIQSLEVVNLENWCYLIWKCIALPNCFSIKLANQIVPTESVTMSTRVWKSLMPVKFIWTRLFEQFVIWGQIEQWSCLMSSLCVRTLLPALVGSSCSSLDMLTVGSAAILTAGMHLTARNGASVLLQATRRCQLGLYPDSSWT